MIERINGPEDLKKLKTEELNVLAQEIRDYIIRTTSKTGGHLAPSLGVVELSIALHYMYNSPGDKIIWDVGHQSYAHKIITGRKKEFSALRTRGGISGFPKRSESPHDCFGTGHSSTSISAALGFACARDLKEEDYDIVAVIGDGSMTGGMAFEGLNNAGHLKKDMLVILNDNKMFISGKVGALGEYLTRIMTFEPFQKMENRVGKILNKYPRGKHLMRIAKRSKVILTPGMLFEEIGFDYFGPVDGHDINKMLDTLGKIRKIKGPKLLHVLTKKGKGYKPAEENPESFHGTSPFDLKTGNSTKNEGSLNYQDVFEKAITELAEEDKDVVAITAAMKSGTGLNNFSRCFPERFFDVGIAEQHAVTFAAGLAAEGRKPVCAIYSTFLQRAYDQIIHDVALQKLPVIFAVDRAGIVGEDGPTHHGAFDLSFLCAVPGIVVAAPSDVQEMRDMLYSALRWEKPTAIRYPRGKIEGDFEKQEFNYIESGKAKVIREGSDITIAALGNTVGAALNAADLLEKEKIKASVVNLRFAKPIDEKVIAKQIEKTGALITVEENVINGGIGQRIAGIIPQNTPMRIMSLPDRFITYGNAEELRKELGISPPDICRKAKELLNQK